MVDEGEKLQEEQEKLGVTIWLRLLESSESISRKEVCYHMGDPKRYV